MKLPAMLALTHSRNINFMQISKGHDRTNERIQVIRESCENCANFVIFGVIWQRTYLELEPQRCVALCIDFSSSSSSSCS